MRQFFKFMFASMVGTFLIGIVLIIVFVVAITGAVGGALASGASFGKGERTKVKDGSVLHITLDQEIVDRPDAEAAGDGDARGGRGRQQL